jgi:pilus assembly protein TadC
VDVALIALLWLAGLVGLGVAGRRLLLRQRSRERMFTQADAPGPATDASRPLTRWLGRAGYRGERAAVNFVSLTALGLCAGVAALVTALGSRLVEDSTRALAGLPGGVGDLFLPAVYLAPWLALVLPPALPWLAVRAARRRRVAAVEEDLPLFLDLLATLGEAGLGFDAALERVLSAQAPGRPLAAEFRTFQLEVLAGRPRIPSLRRLARRVDVISFTIFISALVQAEQGGAGIADVLRRQAEDQRNRRRERATAFAMALPVKLLFPLVICFLPGIFVATLGPTFYQFLQAADGIIRTRRLLP